MVVEDVKIAVLRAAVVEAARDVVGSADEVTADDGFRSYRVPVDEMRVLGARLQELDAARRSASPPDTEPELGARDESTPALVVQGVTDG